ncbi:MAG: glucose-1-phosphate adenylyltransferase subunit GlgD [Schwartzia sp. (in: firmicutes)]
MNSVMGLLDLQRNETRLQELTARRTIASLPFAGRYRIMDFPVSSMVNSGIRNVGVLLPEQSRSVLDHLRSGKDWGLARHHKGLFYLPPVPPEDGQIAGDLRNVYYNLDFIENSNESYVLFVRVNAVYNIDFRPLLRFHQNTGADITMVVASARCDDQADSIVIRKAPDGHVEDVSLRPAVAKGDTQSLGIYLMEKKRFTALVREAFEHGGKDFRRDVIVPAMGKHTIYACEHTGYAARICSLRGFYQANMAMLSPKVWEEMFLRDGAPVLTKVKDMPPVRYKEGAKVTNSLIANGCEIYGKVENSILFRGVHVAPGASVCNSIVMQKGDIQEFAQLDCVICDKNVVVTPEKTLRGAATYPVLVGKQAVV